MLRAELPLYVLENAENNIKSTVVSNYIKEGARLADDMAMLISDAEKPTERFEDVVGAGAAKDAPGV